MIRAAWDAVGLEAASPTERQFAVYGAAICLSAYLAARMMLRAMFGWLLGRLERRRGARAKRRRARSRRRR